MRIPSLVAFTLLSVAVSIRPAAAQSETRGLTVGVEGGVSALTSGLDRSGQTAGGSLGVTLGYGVSDAVSLFARATTGYEHALYDVGARVSLGTRASSLRPYFEGALTHSRSTDALIRARGPGLTAAAGVEYFLNPKVSLDAGLAYSTGRLTRADSMGTGIRGDGFQSARLKIGVRLRP